MVSRWEYNWDKVTLEPVRVFNKLYASFAPLRKVTTPEETLLALNNYSFGEMGIARVLDGFKNEKPWALPTKGRTGDYDFATWTKANFPLKDRTVQIASSAYDLQQAAFWLFENWKDDTKIGHTPDASLLSAAQEFLGFLDIYKNDIQKMLNMIYPEHFNHAGFRIVNLQHLAKPVVNELLGGIDFLKNWFKSKGLLKILEEGISYFKLEMEAPSRDRSKMAAAYYDVDDHSISIMAATAFSSKINRLLDSWVKQVFLHEFGHYLHLAYITGEAKEFWDSWWDKIKEVKDIQERYATPITQKERQQFYKGLKYTKFNLKKYRPRAALLDHDDYVQIRYHVWLTHLEYDRQGLFNPTHNYKQLPRITSVGQEIFEFLADPLAGLRDAEDKTKFKQEVFHKQAVYEDIFGVNDSYPGPRIPDKAKEEMFKDLSSEEQMIDNLGIPSGYGRTNEEEDFAESFVLFVTEPRSLSPLAQFRMKRTLSLSGLYGKPVMRFADVVEELIQDGMTEEAVEVLATALRPYKIPYKIVPSRDNGKILYPISDQELDVKHLKRSRHVYRGMEQAEFKATVGKRQGIQSCGTYSFSTEGTCFAYDPEIAEDYANFGRSNPLKTGKPTFLLEVDYRDQIPKKEEEHHYWWREKAQGSRLKEDTDGYPKAPDMTPFKRITRIWIMVPEGDTVRIYQIKV